ncbi:MAG: glycosyltransferase [Firmicutes bacterium]|nr:glycosyltransferase [Bacillota bacterium]
MKKKETVSLCLIVKNEEEFILSCIHSVRHLVDEIVVVDTGSRDQTARLAIEAGARVFDFTWRGDFALARNFALEQANSDWLLVLDADEVLEPLSVEDFNRLLCARDVEGYFLQIKNYLGAGQEVSWDQVVRLFRNKPGYRFRGAIHEQVAPSILDANHGGGLAVAPLVIHHYGYLKEQVLKKEKFNRNTSIIKRALDSNPADPFLLYCLAVEHYQRGNVAEGLDCLEKALTRMGGREGYFEDVVLNIALGLLKLDRTERLIEFASKSLKMFPEHPDLFLLRGLGFLNLGKYLEAAGDLDRSLLKGGSRVLPESCVRELMGESGLLMKRRVLVASPVRQKESILAEFLESLGMLDTTGLELDFAFIDDNNGHDLLAAFALGKSNVRVFPFESGDSYLCDETTHYWREELIWKVAAFKNKFIKIALEEGYDYLFLVDSDLYLHPKTVAHLVSLGKDIVSQVYWTRWEPGMAPLPQVWAGEQYRLYHLRRGEVLSEEEASRRTAEFLQMLSAPGTYRVGGLGACTLISRRALSMGVSFSEIYNLGYIGEDRHFCVRAAALGLELYADTHYPPFHIYRESELSALKAFKKRIAQPINGISFNSKDVVNTPVRHKRRDAGSRITLAMLVRNEAGRYLERVLEHAARYIDSAVILDDASEDDTLGVCRKVLYGIPLTLISNKEPCFNNEIVLRKQLWELTVDTGPDWILILDADEIFEDRAPEVLRSLARRPDVYYYSFRLYDMWDEHFYREDAYWKAHNWYRPFMVRYVPDFHYLWKETPQHCGRFPKNIEELRGDKSQLRIKHLGWMKPEDRLKKYYRYKQLDPESIYGIKEQYQSILDPRPNLVPWVEEL